MTTPVFICGAECGIAVVGALSAGTEHWSAINGTPTIVTSGPATMRSTRCFRFNPVATTNQTLVTTFATAIGSPATIVTRFYLYFATLPNVNTLIFLDAPGAGGTVGCVQFNTSDSSVYASTNSTFFLGPTGVPVTTGQWYRIDYKAVHDTTMTVDVNVDGVACGQYTQAATASTVTGFEFGAFLGSGTADIYIDDLIVSGTSADYPISEGTIAGLYPTGDKTNSSATPTDGNGGHLFSATTDFGKGAGGATATGAQNVEATSWQSLQNPLSTTIGANFIADLAGAATEHLVWTHTALPAAAAVNGMGVVATSHSATAVSNNQSMTITDSAGANGLQAWNVLDLSELTITVPTAVFSTKPGGGAWTKATVDACLIRWGDSSDVNPDAYLDGVCLEVDYIPGLAFSAHSLFIPKGKSQAIRKASVW